MDFVGATVVCMGRVTVLVAPGATTFVALLALIGSAEVGLGLGTVEADFGGGISSSSNLSEINSLGSPPL